VDTLLATIPLSAGTKARNSQSRTVRSAWAWSRGRLSNWLVLLTSPPERFCFVMKRARDESSNEDAEVGEEAPALDNTGCSTS
jgi:hypothetical protein